VGALALVAACAVTAPPLALPDAADCVIPAGLTPRQASLAGAVQAAARAGPLFAESIGASGIAACRIEAAEGAVTVRYRAADGGEFHLRRDETIEATEIEARLIAAPVAVPESLLRRAERAAFGDAGCGIDWRRPEAGRSSVVPDGVDTVYQGLTCNCRAIERRDPNGVVVGLALSSAC
jgi:hypothetical protein